MMAPGSSPASNPASRLAPASRPASTAGPASSPASRLAPASSSASVAGPASSPASTGCPASRLRLRRVPRRRVALHRSTLRRSTPHRSIHRRPWPRRRPWTRRRTRGNPHRAVAGSTALEPTSRTETRGAPMTMLTSSEVRKPSFTKPNEETPWGTPLRTQVPAAVVLVVRPPESETVTSAAGPPSGSRTRPVISAGPGAEVRARTTVESGKTSAARSSMVSEAALYPSRNTARVILPSGRFSKRNEPSSPVYAKNGPSGTKTAVPPCPEEAFTNSARRALPRTVALLPRTSWPTLMFLPRPVFRGSRSRRRCLSGRPSPSTSN